MSDRPADSRSLVPLQMMTGAGIALSLLGWAVIAGWVFDIQVLVRLQPQYAPMPLLTAVLFLVSGASLIILRYHRTAAAILGGGIAATGWLIATDYLFGNVFSMDSAIRPAAPTALCFALCGSALGLLGVLREGRRMRPLLWILCSICASLGFMAVIGYVVGLSGTYVWGQSSGMAIHTALGMIVLSFGLLAATSWLCIGAAPLDDRWFPVPIGVAGVSASVLLWHALVSDQARVDLAPHTGANDPTGLPWLILGFGVVLTGFLILSLRSLRRMRRLARDFEEASWLAHREAAEKQEAQNRLRESELLLQTLLNAATGVSLIGADTEGVITYFSRGAEKMLGYSAEEMVGKSTPEVFHDAGEMAARCAELSEETGRPVKGAATFTTIPDRDGTERREWTYVCKDGSRKTVDLTVTVVRDSEGGKVLSYLGTALDITEIKQTEQRLRDLVLAEQNANALLDAAGRIAKLGHWELAIEKDELRWSETTCAIHGAPRGTTLTLEQALQYHVPEERHIVERLMKRAMNDGTTFDFEARIITRQGRRLWVHSRGEPVRDAQGSIVALRGVLQDVDERHQAAELLTRRNWELEVATTQAQAHARAKAEFLANMSHEIRTPLNAIIGMSDLLHDVTMDDVHREYVSTIRVSGDALLSIINDILDFSKIEAGQLDLEQIPVDLYECVESSFDLVSSQAAKKKLDLLYWIEPAVPAYVLGDPTRLRQILVNFTTNAVKFTESGEVFVRISRTGSPEHGEKLHISVRDTGIGISPEHQHRLFQSFSQVDSSTSRKYGGTGLGLAICHRLVTMMKGRVWVESEPGKGADFQFEIPLAPADVSPTQVYQRGQSRELEGMRLLIVDDNETNRWILEAQSKSWGMVPRSTALPVDALSWIERGDPFDVAILDGHMPHMNGFELAERIKTHASAQSLPVMVLTSMGDAGAAAGRPGVTAVLSKPIKTQALYDNLFRMVQGGRGEVRRKTAPVSNPQWAVDYPLKVLVAEDNPVNQRVISLMLERLGYRAEIVANGLEVLAAVHRTQFDLVLMDVQMPEMDGLQAAREMCRLHDRTERPRMVALTANAVAGDREDCLAAGMDGYLSKPVRSNELAEALRETFLERQKLEQTLLASI